MPGCLLLQCFSLSCVWVFAVTVGVSVSRVSRCLLLRCVFQSLVCLGVCCYGVCFSLSCVWVFAVTVCVSVSRVSGCLLLLCVMCLGVTCVRKRCLCCTVLWCLHAEWPGVCMLSGPVSAC